MNRISFFVLFLAVTCFAFTGCEQKPEGTNGKAGTVKEDANDHDHDHDHADHDDHDDHAMQLGPNKGHTYKLEPADYMIEWVHYKGNHRNDFFILDAAGKENVALKVDSFSVKSTVGEDDETYLLDPIGADDSGAAAQYGLEKQELSIAMTLGVKVDVKVGDKTFQVSIPPQVPHEH